MTAAQKIGALAALIAGLAGAYLGTRTVTNPTSTRACIAFSGTKPAGLKVTRAVVGLSPLAQQTLGLAPIVPWAYGAVEIQAQADAGAVGALNDAVVKRVMGELEVSPEAAWDRTAQGAVAPSCQILVIREDDPVIRAAATDAFRCGCATDATCLIGGAPAPRGVTLDPGTFTGAGCLRKPCVGFMGWPDTLPAACK